MTVHEDFLNYLNKNLVDPELQRIWHQSFSAPEMEDYVKLHTRYNDVNYAPTNPNAPGAFDLAYLFKARFWSPAGFGRHTAEEFPPGR